MKPSAVMRAMLGMHTMLALSAVATDATATDVSGTNANATGTTATGATATGNAATAAYATGATVTGSTTQVEPHSSGGNGTPGVDMATAEMSHGEISHGAMSYRQMADTMQMDDTKSFGKVMLDQLEWRDGDSGEGRGTWDAQGYYGGDYDKLWIKTEGKYVSGRGAGVRDANVEALWDRVISAWWNLQAGGRQDIGPGQSRTWVAVGVQGLAPQWFQTEATLYASDEGRTAARLKAQYDLMLTQRLVLQPFAEANLYGRSDPARQLGSGLSDLEISLRLRYELRREFAPYVGLVWLRRLGGTADLVRSAGGKASDLELAAGLRVWF